MHNRRTVDQWLPKVDLHQMYAKWSKKKLFVVQSHGRLSQRYAKATDHRSGGEQHTPHASLRTSSDKT